MGECLKERNIFESLSYYSGPEQKDRGGGGDGRRSGDTESVSIWQNPTLHNAPSVPSHARKCVSPSTHSPRHENDGSPGPQVTRMSLMRVCVCVCVCVCVIWG